MKISGKIVPLQVESIPKVKNYKKKKIRFKKIVRISFSINLNWFQEMLKILTTDSRCCMAETNTTLQSNYAPIKKIYLND